MRKMVHVGLFALVLFCVSSRVGMSADEAPIRLPLGTTDLLDVGLYRVGYRYFPAGGGSASGGGGQDVWFPVGWMGHFDEKCGLACTPEANQNGKKPLLLHCPWRGGTGIAFLEYDLALPKETPITFSYAIAMRSDAVGKSDGVTFRVFLGENGRLKKVLDKHYESDAWEEHKEDLSAFAGRTVTIRLETDPGPARNSGFDFSLWGDPQISVGPSTGATSEILNRMLRDPRLRKEIERSADALINDSSLGVRPSTYEPVENKLSKRSNAWLFEASDASGIVRYRLDPAKKFLDGLSVEVIPKEKAGIGALLDEIFGAKLKSIFWPCQASGPVATFLGKGQETITPDHLARQLLSCERRGDEMVLAEQYTVTEGANSKRSFQLKTVLKISGRSLVIETESKDAVISELRYGQLRAPLRRIITLPYLTFTRAAYLPDQLTYVTMIPDWTASAASSLGANSARYGAKTDETRNALQERAFLTVSPFLSEVLPNLPNTPSPYLKEISDRLVYDIWGGKLEENGQWLRELKSYGLDRTIMLNHVWQRGGYDNEYPTVLPANAKLGGDEGMKSYAAAARDVNCAFCLHENYVDFYPNSEAYNVADVSLNSKGEPVKAWYNKGIKQQSYAYKPLAILKYANQFSPEIHNRYGTTGCFLDVHSAVPPWFHVDFRASEPQAGMFKPVWYAHRALWDYERQTHKGPVFGEGHNHFFWSGYLDGAEAQLEGGESALPLLDFDLLKIHPLQLNHGMGYYSRWLSKEDATTRRHGMPTEEKMDKYRALEIAFAHAGFLGTETWRCVPYAVREYYMTTPFTARCACSRPLRILYEIEGRFVGASTAAALGKAEHLMIEYEGGLRVWVNLSDNDWTVEGQSLPQFGFFATGAGVTGGTTRRQGVISDYVETADVIFADARSVDAASAAAQPHFRAIEPRLASFQYLGGGKIAFKYEFKVDQAPRKDYVAFVHFTNPKLEEHEGIAFQQDHKPVTPTSQWKANTVVSDGPYEMELKPDAKPGKYTWLIGLYEPAGSRLGLLGKDIGSSRIELGTLEVVSKDGKITDIRFERPKGEKSAVELAREASERRLNTKKVAIDFGKIITAGCVVLRRTGDSKWELIPVPRGQTFEVSLRPVLLDPKLSPKSLKVTSLDRDKKELRVVPAKAVEDRLSFIVGAPDECFYLLGG